MEKVNETPTVLSIVIVNFETPDYTLECIRSIQAYPPSCAYEIIVIDNGSRDGSFQRIRHEAPEVRSIEMGKNTGFSKANNLGISNALGSYILLLNSDTKILDNSLDRMLESIMADSSLGALGPRQIDGQGHLQLSWGRFPTLISEIYRKLIHYRLSINDLRVRDYLEEKYVLSSEVDWVSGSCFLTRREVLESVGMLDENFFMYFEDLDLCQRIKNLKYKIHYYPKATIVHYGGVSAKKNFLRVLLEYRRSQIYFTRKYYGLAGVSVVKLLLLTKYGFHFVKNLGIYLFEKFFSKSNRRVFAKVLLTKKVLETVFYTRAKNY